MLATNLSEGGLCSFTREGLILQHRMSPTSFRFERIQVDLATVAMGVAASSAFPGFFPPLQLSSSDVGASQGDFNRQSFTDGGVFDNLGIRMFRFIGRAWIGREARVQREDVVDIDAALEKVNATLRGSEDVPGARFGNLLASAANGTTRFENADQLLEALSTVMRDMPLYRIPLFDELRLALPDAQATAAYVLQVALHDASVCHLALGQPSVSAARTGVIACRPSLLERAFRPRKAPL